MAGHKQSRRVVRKRRIALLVGIIAVFLLVCFGVSRLFSDDHDLPEVSSTSDVSSQQLSVPDPEGISQTEFSNWAVLGNSYIDGFAVYNVLPEMDCFYRIGLTVRTVFTKPMMNKETPVIDELKNDKKYEKIFLIFGENELGWTNEQAFSDGYIEVIDAVRERQPGAKLYAMSILPVSKKVSEENIDNTNNERIREYNAMIQKIAREKDVTYLDVASAVADENGNLPDDAASDGIHPGIEYYQIWADYLVKNTKSETK